MFVFVFSTVGRSTSRVRTLNSALRREVTHSLGNSRLHAIVSDVCGAGERKCDHRERLNGAVYFSPFVTPERCPFRFMFRRRRAVCTSMSIHLSPPRRIKKDSFVTCRRAREYQRRRRRRRRRRRVTKKQANETKILCAFSTHEAQNGCKNVTERSGMLAVHHV